MDYGWPQTKRFSARAATVSPIDRDDVAAGEGALQTLIAFFSSKIKKSSTSPPWRSHAWARTPAPPASRSCSCISGISTCRALVKAGFENDLYISPHPVLQYFAATFLNPGHNRDSVSSENRISVFLYPSRRKARTALGPASTPPLAMRVKCTPRKGKLGSGTG